MAILVGLEIVKYGTNPALCRRSIKLGMVKVLCRGINFLYIPQLAEGHKGVKSKMATKMAAI